MVNERNDNMVALMESVDVKTISRPKRKNSSLCEVPGHMGRTIMKFTLIAASLLLAQNAFGQTCSALLDDFLDNRENMITAGRIANRMYDKGCWNIEPAESGTKSDAVNTCEALAERIIEQTRGTERHVHKLTGLRQLDFASRKHLRNLVISRNPLAEFMTRQQKRNLQVFQKSRARLNASCRVRGHRAIEFRTLEGSIFLRSLHRW